MIPLRRSPLDDCKLPGFRVDSHAMELPDWVERDIRSLPERFTGQIVVEVWDGGVTRRDIIERRTAPKTQQQHAR